MSGKVREDTNRGRKKVNIFKEKPRNKSKLKENKKTTKNVTVVENIWKPKEDDSNLDVSNFFGVV